MSLQVQDLFRAHPKDVVIQLLSELGVDYHEEESCGVTYAHLDYGIAADRTSEVVKECRGLGLIVGSWDIARMSFYRFLNYDETGRDPFNHNDSILYEEKMDGSLIILRHLEGNWIAGTRGRLFPDALVQGYQITFPQLFWKIFVDSGGKEELLDKNLCYSFELCAPENRVVVLHSKRKIVLLGARGCQSWSELDRDQLDEEAKRLSFDRPKLFEFKSIKACLDHAKTLGGDQEGFVIVQWNDRIGRSCRAKIKAEAYIALHNIVSARSLPNLVRLVIKDQRAALNDFPEYQDAFDLIRKVLHNFCDQAQATFEGARHFLESPDRSYGDSKNRRRLFAQHVMQTDHGNLCFSLADGKYETAFCWLRDKKRIGRSALRDMIDRFDLGTIVGESWNIVADPDQDI